MDPAANLPEPPPKGERVPGSGRKKGTPSKRGVGFRTLIAQMVEDPEYQHRLRHDFRLRKVHPMVESNIWAYHIGKPKTEIELSGSLELTRRFESDREKLQTLGLAELEALALASQELVDRAFDAAVSGRLLQPAPQDVVIEALQDKADTELLGNVSGSDNKYYGALNNPAESAPASDGDDEA